MRALGIDDSNRRSCGKAIELLVYEAGEGVNREKISQELHINSIYLLVVNPGIYDDIFTSKSS